MAVPISPAKRSRAMVSQLKDSEIFKDYQEAFRQTTGLLLSLTAIESFNLSHHHDPNENSFCALMAKSNHTCSACLQLQAKIEKEASMEPKTLKCFAGLCDSSVPVRVGENLVAFLQTGQILTHSPTKKQFTAVTREILKYGTDVDLKSLEEAWFHSLVVPQKQYDSILRLLSIFAQHLSVVSNQRLLRIGGHRHPQTSVAFGSLPRTGAKKLAAGSEPNAVDTESARIER